MTEITIFDTTLRDGSQGTGISFSLADKIDIARRLDAFGMDYVEGGWPGSNPKDAEFFEAMRSEPLKRARLTAFGSTRHAGKRAEDDENLRLLVAAATPAVAIFAKSWDFHVELVLRTTLEENLAMVRDSVAYLKGEGREVIFDAEHFFDGVKANRDYAFAVLKAAAEAGASWLVLCDTNGGSLPSEVSTLVAKVAADLGVPVGIHAHNDGELAVANSLAAVEAGVRQVQGTINGYGERIGNANLCSVLPNLVLKEGVRCAAGENLADLTALARAVETMANVAPNPRLPYVGAAAFAHKGGVHVHAVAADPRTYEHVDPAAVGNERRILVSELSGRQSIVERARSLGLDLEHDSPAAVAITHRIKELESEGFKFEDAEGSFALLVHRLQPGYRAPFIPLAYHIDTHKSPIDEGSHSLATAEVSVGGEVLRGEALGGGPVDALEKAVRRALIPAYPSLDRVGLIDFRSYIARVREGPRGNIAVRITGTAPGSRPWTTIGSARDLLHASWIALTDNLELALINHAGVSDAIGSLLPKSKAIPVAELAKILKPAMDEADRATLDRMAKTDWSHTALDLDSAADRRFAADAVSLGAAIFYSFGNFCAVAARPEHDSVVRVNLFKGRPENQVGSLSTTRPKFDALFDWSAVPAALPKERVRALMDDLFELGPFGFRGPAAAHIPAYLTSRDADIRTTQLIGPGYRCLSNELLAECLDRAGQEFLFITSANVSKGVTGHVEPAHYDMRGIAADFGKTDGVVFIAHRDEAAVRASYPQFLPMSTSIIAFHKLARDEDGAPALILERHGSLGVEIVRAVVKRHELGLVPDEKAKERLPMRDAAEAASLAMA
ncbi:MAG: citramalate synthase [Bauldia sp.]|nr:citramalate synthase [Bauldia sp.]